MSHASTQVKTAPAAQVLTVNDLVVDHPSQRGAVHAVAGVSLELVAGETLGLVGESGCGKSSLARAITGLNTPSSGQIQINGNVIGTGNRFRKERAQQIQMVFQDPFGSLNPRSTVAQLVEEPLNVHAVGPRSGRQKQARALLERVGLALELHDRLPHQLSGGQRQRVGIARALALRPDVLVCDEPVSALDVSVQAQVLNLLLDLQKEFGFAYLFISHDLDVIRYVSNRIAVMYLGVLVESGPAEQVWNNPQHPYTRALVDMASLDGNATRVVLNGELPSPMNPPSGCRFRTRCPFVEARCAESVPLLQVTSEKQYAACHRLGEWQQVLSAGQHA
jgi:oligopeptide/dipeptide ABC transporter ATP-binding protein